MKAIVAHGPLDLRVDDWAAPDLAPDEVHVEIVYAGICGSDLHYHQHGRNGTYEIREPLILGHEVVGRIAAVGAHAGVDLPVGTPVAVHPATPTPAPGQTEGNGLNLTVGGTYLGSASTWPHTQGGMAETLPVTGDQLRPLPADLPLRRAALAEPLSIALHGVDRAKGLVEGARVLVCGSGPIGLLAVAALKRRGAAHVTATDLHARPLQIARAIGADATVQLGVDPAPEPESFDITVEAAGVLPSTVAAIGAARRGGTVIQLGILPKGDLGAPLSTIVSNELSYLGCQRFDIEMDEAIEILAESPELDAVVTDVFAADSAAEAFAKAADSAVSTKVLVAFQPE